MKLVVASLLIASTTAFVAPRAAHTSTLLAATVEKTAGLVPPRSLEDMKKDATTKDLYDQNVQKTYG
jgi:hypothetical protein